MYFAITTATTTGYGDITPYGDSERIFILFAMITTAIFFGYTLGSISSVYEMINASHFRREAKTNALNQYIIEKQLPWSLARRVRNYFHRYILRRSAYDEEEFLSCLTESLRREVIMFLHRDVIDTLPFFKTFVHQMTLREIERSSFSGHLEECVDLNLLYEIVTSLTPIYALPGEFLCREGEAPREIIFLVSGRIQLLRKSLITSPPIRPPRPQSSLHRRASIIIQRMSSIFERPGTIHATTSEPLSTEIPVQADSQVGTIEPGGLYGEAEVLLNKPHAATLQAVTLIEAYSLSRENTKHLIHLFPSFGDYLARNLLAFHERQLPKP
jgi:CRP-like cAMP-binding protein